MLCFYAGLDTLKLANEINLLTTPLWMARFDYDSAVLPPVFIDIFFFFLR